VRPVDKTDFTAQSEHESLTFFSSESDRGRSNPAAVSSAHTPVARSIDVRIFFRRPIRSPNLLQGDDRPGLPTPDSVSEVLTNARRQSSNLDTVRKWASTNP
jgi:hypothetical protein